MRLAAVAAIALALCGGCTPPADEEAPVTPSVPSVAVAEPTTAGESPASASPVERTEPPFTADTEIDVQEGDGGDLAVVDVRVDSQDGFDRVIFDLDGEGTPGWRVIYVEEPLAEVAGEAFLQVTLTSIDSERATADRLSDPGTGAVREVRFASLDDGTYNAIIGLGETVPFRVYGLDNPTRVVVEAVHPDS